MNKRPQLLTTLLVFWPLPPTRSKEASAGGVTAECRRKREGKGARREEWWCRCHGEAGQCLIFGLN